MEEYLETGKNPEWLNGVQKANYLTKNSNFRLLTMEALSTDAGRIGVGGVHPEATGNGTLHTT